MARLDVQSSPSSQIGIPASFAAGAFDIVTGDVERLGGRPPEPLREVPSVDFISYGKSASARLAPRARLHARSVSAWSFHSYSIGVLTACNAPAPDPRLVAGEVYATVTVAAGCWERKFVLSLIGSDDLIANSAALPLTVICPHF
jgi:hypothetical protein